MGTNKIRRYKKSFSKRNKAHNNLLKHKTQRMWIEEEEDIHVLNYWYYRYFTNRYLNWLREKAIA